MNGVGYHLLTCAVLSQDEHRRIRWGYSFHSGEEIGEGLIVADDPGSVEAICRAVGIRSGRHSGLWLILRVILIPGIFIFLKTEGRGHTLKKKLIVPGLGDEVEGTVTHSLHGKLDASPGRDENHGRVREKDLDFAQKLDPLLARSAQAIVHVHQDEIVVLLTHFCQRLVGSGGTVNIISGSLQQEAQGEPYRLIVVNNQNHSSKLQKIVLLMTILEEK